ncbi:MAG: hypothetical protein JXR37_07810 [Kiritimatiellae bacterium]|nr:hypothetical protein [Kiritimatiellia bacterium]
MKEVAWIPMGGRESPGTRLRVLEIAEALGARFGVRSLFPQLRLTAVPDALFVEKVCDPNVLGLAGRLRGTTCRTFLDLCDPIWQQEAANRQRHWDVDRAVAEFDCVTVPTPFLQRGVQARYPGVRCWVLPDSVDVAGLGLPALKQHEERDLLRIGWIGTSLNMLHLKMVVPALQELSRERACCLRLITRDLEGFVPALPHIAVEYVPWTVESYAARLFECDLAVIPVPLTRWTSGKSPNRLQLCLAAGIPAVVSPLPSYVAMLAGHEDIAFIARHDADWLTHLRCLSDAAVRNAVARQGRELVRREHSRAGVLGLWREVLFTRPLGSRSAPEAAATIGA